METTRQEKRKQAIEYMTTLGIYEDYITGFREDDKVCFFENYGGYWAFQEPELIEKIREFEKEHNCLVYAVTHEFTEFGELYDLLIVTDCKGEWRDLLVKDGSVFYAFAYVWNKDDDRCSEFGTIGVKSFGGGIRRCE